MCTKREQNELQSLTEARCILHRTRTFIIRISLAFCKRLFKNVEDMNETLIENWNRVVGQDDIVFHWGIFAWEDPMNGPRFLTD